VGSVTLRFWARANSSYTIQYREAVDSGEWVRWKDVAAGAARWITETNVPPTSTRFYRLRTPAGL
jgi:hypothetical protein